MFMVWTSIIDELSAIKLENEFRNMYMYLWWKLMDGGNSVVTIEVCY